MEISLTTGGGDTHRGTAVSQAGWTDTEHRGHLRNPRREKCGDLDQHRVKTSAGTCEHETKLNHKT